VAPNRNTLLLHPSSSINSQKLAMAIGSWMATSEIQLGPARRYIGEIAIQREYEYIYSKE
jgi:hypothetical protein